MFQKNQKSSIIFKKTGANQILILKQKTSRKTPIKVHVFNPNIERAEVRITPEIYGQRLFRITIINKKSAILTNIIWVSEKVGETLI